MEHLGHGAGAQFDAELVGHMDALGRAGDLGQIVGHGAEGIPLVVRPHCGPIVAIPRTTKDGDIVYCRACHGELRLNRKGATFEAEMIGMTDDPKKLLPVANMDVIEGMTSQTAD